MKNQGKLAERWGKEEALMKSGGMEEWRNCDDRRRNRKKRRKRKRRIRKYLKKSFFLHKKMIKKKTNEEAIGGMPLVESVTWRPFRMRASSSFLSHSLSSSFSLFFLLRVQPIQYLIAGASKETSTSS